MLMYVGLGSGILATFTCVTIPGNLEGHSSGLRKYWLLPGFRYGKLEGQGMKEGVEPGTPPYPDTCHYGAEGRFRSWLSGSMASSKGVEWVDMGSRAN